MADSDPPDLIIRSYSESDLPDLQAIAAAAWQPVFDSYRNMLGPELFGLAYENWQAAKCSQIETACRGDRDAHVIVGVVRESRRQPERSPHPEAPPNPQLPRERVIAFLTYYLDTGNGLGEIGNNAVDPTCQAAGVGTRMLRHALEQMREAGARCVRVTTGLDPSHAPARRMYEKAGFARGTPHVTYFQEL